MSTDMKKCVQNQKIRKAQSFRGIRIFPIFVMVIGWPKYLTLEEAAEKDLITVVEVSEDGSVPNTKVNRRTKDQLTLLLDGEELQGAKQNRVFNTTVLLAPMSIFIKPVSCSEEGRWSYESHEFSPSTKPDDTKIWVSV